MLLEHGRLRGALLLTLCGIDAMAFLGMEPTKVEVRSSDFIAWADRYIQFPCENKISGSELYAARCAALHQYGTESRKSREGTVRQILWKDESRPEVLYAADKHQDFVLVSIPALAAAFFSGIDQFLVPVYADKTTAKIVDGRFQKLIHELPVPDAEPRP